MPSRRAADTETGVDLGRRLAPGTLLAGRYRIVAVVGVGGMGVVYRARDEELAQDVALKVLRPDLGTDPEWIERFRSELILAREVTHRNVVRTHDIGESQGLRFLSMRFVEGRSLLDVLQKEGPLPLDRALKIVRQLAEALGQAHEAGVVHRDLKPANVLLESDDTAYVTDFGIARSMTGGGITRTGAVVGTPDYLSPEQVCGDPVDGRSDLYTLGILFYEMLSGRLPFEASSQAEAIAQRLTGRVRDIGATGVTVPAWVRGVIGRCLERLPSRRYSSAGELLHDLDRRSASGSRGRSPWLVGAAAAIAAFALAGLVWLALRGAPAGSTPDAPVPAAAAPASHALAILPLVDETADPALGWTSGGIAEMLAAELAESPDLRVLDPQRLLRTLRDLRLADGRYDDAALRRLAEILEVDRLVAGSVRRAGDALRVDLRLVSVGPSGALTTRQVAADSPATAGLFGIVSGLGGRLRGELGAKAPVAAGNEAATSSLDAAQAFREARDHLAVGDYVGAKPALERAIAADAGFALALERLAETYQSLGYHEKALAVAGRAVEAAGGAETRLGHRARARLALLKGNPAEAIESYTELARLYPNDVEALLDLASAQASRGALESAVATLKRAAALDRNDPRVWYLLGRNAILLGDAARATSDYLVRALTLQTQLKNEQGQADVLNALGIARHELGNYAEAIETYTKAAALRQSLGDQRGVAASVKNRARAYVALGRLTEAEPDLRKARSVLERIGDQAGLGDVMDEFGALHEARGEFGAALTAYQEALRIRRGLGDERQIAQSHDNVGYIYYLQGEYENALAFWQQALERRRGIGEKDGIVLSMQNMGFIQTALGRWAEATKLFAEALGLAREIEFKSGMAVSLGQLGVLHQYDGRYLAALASLEEALAIYRELQDTRGLAEFTLKQAEALLELGRLDAAKTQLDAAAPWVREIGNRERSADFQILIGEWHARRGEAEAARRAFAEAMKEAAASQGRAVLLRARTADAFARAAAGESAAVASLAAAQRDAESLGDALLLIRASEALARAQLMRGRPREAEDAARRALKVATRADWKAGLYRLHALLARALDKNGDTRGAAAEYAASAAGIAGLRAGLDAELLAAFEALPEVKEVAARSPLRAGGT